MIYDGKSEFVDLLKSYHTENNNNSAKCKIMFAFTKR